MTLDLDSTICEVHGDHKEGATLWLHAPARLSPAVATCAETGEVE